MANQKIGIELTAQDKTKAAFDSVTRNLGQVKGAAAGINSALGAIGVGLSFAGLAASVKSSIDAMDDLSKAAQKVGLTTEALSGLKYAAELADVSFEQLQTGIGQLALKLDEAKAGVKSSVDLFRRLELDPRQFQDAEQALKAIADRFQQLPDGLAKTAIAKDIGRAWVDLIPLLNQGADGIRAATDEARKFGRVVSTEAGRAAEEFNDNLTRIKAQAQGLGISLANEVLPILVEMSREMASMNGQGGVNFMAGARTALEALVILGANVAYVFRQTGNEIGGIAAQLSRLAALDFKGFSAIGRMMKEDAARARAELDAFEKRIMGLSARVQAGPPAKTSGASDPRVKCMVDGGVWDGKKCVLLKDIKPRGGGGKAADPLASILSQTDTQRLAEYTKLYDLLNQRFDYGRKNAQLYAEAVDVLNRRFFADDLREYEKAERDKAEATRLDAEFTRDLAEATREAEQANLDYHASIKETEQALLDMVEPTAAALRELSRLEALRDLPGINQDIVTAAILKQQEAVDKALTGVEDKNQETVDFVTEAWKAAAKNMESALADFLFDPFADGLDGMLDGFVNTLRRMAAEAAAAQIMEGLFGKEFGGGIIGGFISGIFGGGKAIGGPVDSGTAYLVGEKGPELFVPSVSGTIVPNHQMAKAGINQSITINVSAPTGTVSRDSLQQMQTAVGAATARAIRRNT